MYDGAGVVAMPDYDFKGNALTQLRTYTLDATQRPDWTNITAVAMETGDYETGTLYDALNRPLQLITPDTGKTKYTYDRGGMLYSVAVEGVHSLDSAIVNKVEYDAKGQRQKIQYQNGATTTYGYDASTFRVRNIKTTRASDGKVLQDLQYWYDPVGNITLQKDLAQQDVYFANTVVSADHDNTYDALYRLIQSKGRELIGNDGATSYNDSSRSGKNAIPFVNNVPPPSDANALRRYTEQYSYDAVGNMTELYHNAGGTSNWTRTFTISGTSNRLTGCSIGSNNPVAETYSYDSRGNLTSGMNHLQSLTYNAENRLEQVAITSTRTAYYQYDANGQRVRKTITDTSSNTTEIRKYIGEWEVYSKLAGSSLNIERETLHISDDTGRMALIDTRIQGTGAEPQQLLRYQYSNHLGSATLELDYTGAIISYEEYYPYGSTSFQSGRSLAEVSLKRYRYTGKERDEETGLYYHGARYYIPWLCRWLAADPINSENYNLQNGNGRRNSKRTYLSLSASSYEYAYDSPIEFSDSTGEQPDKQPRKIVRQEGKAVITEELDARIPSTKTTPKQQSAPPTAEEYLSDTYTEFKKMVNNAVEDKDYIAAIQFVSEKYRFSDIVNQKIMKINYAKSPLNDSKNKIQYSHGYYETSGLANSYQSVDVNTADLVKASESIENFAVFIIAMVHEQIHGYQRGVQGSISSEQHPLREFIANQFGVFPNDSIFEKEFLKSKAFKVSFVEVSASMKFVWAATAIQNYNLMSAIFPSLGEKYKSDAEKLVNTGLESYEQIKDVINPDKKTEMQKLYNILKNFK